MSNFFRKIPRPLVVLVLVSALCVGPVLGAEGDSLSSPSGASSDVGGSGGFDTITVSGADVTVNVEKHDTLSVSSVPSEDPDSPEESPRVSSYSVDPPTLAETVVSLFGPYTPRTQTVTTYYDGQPIATEEQLVPGLAGLDFEWIAGVGLFALVVFCLFRLLGGVLRNG